jgi:hypothetical protein
MIPWCYKESRCVIDTAGSDPAVSLTPRDLMTCGVIDITGSDPVVSMTPLNPLALSHWNHWIFYKNVHRRDWDLNGVKSVNWSAHDQEDTQVRSCGVFDTAATLDLIPWSHWHCGIWFRCLIDIAGSDDTAESTSAVSLKLQNLLQKCIRQILWCHWRREINRSSWFSWRIRSHMLNSFSSWIRAL